MSSIQPQFDIVGAATTSTTVASALIRNFGKLFNQCFQEGVQPLVIPPLERLGSWLMVDADRLRDGENTFLKMPAPKLWSWHSLSIIVGLSNDPKDSLVRTVIQDQCLIAAFLCLAACTTCFDTQMASSLMHELMRLNGTLKDYSIPGHMVHQFAEAINGCTEFIVGEKPSDVYDKLAKGVNHATSSITPQLGNLYNAGDTAQLAKIIYETFEKMQNQDFQFVWLKGTLQGLWLASFFVWLRPKEVVVQVPGSIIYPFPDQHVEGEGRFRRLIISLENSGTGAIPDSFWHITPWTTTASIPVRISLQDDENTKGWLKREHPSPLKSARCQLSLTRSTRVVTNIGNVAAALVVTAIQNGRLWNQCHTISQPLQDLCSESFLGSYPGILGEFGFTIDLARRGNIVRILDRIITNKAVLSSIATSHTNDIEFLKEVMVASSREYVSEFQEPMLFNSSSAEEEVVFEHAIHLAGEALLFAFCDKLSMSFLYRPLEPFRLSENAKLLRSLFQAEVGYDFWALRKRVIQTLIPGSTAIESGDLAVAGNGYVVYSRALTAWNEGLMTDRRKIASLCIFPGPLKANNVEGKISRFTEDKENTSLLSRFINLHADSVNIYQNGSCRLDESEAINKARTQINHSYRFENAVQTVYMITFIKSDSNRVPTSWRRSIDAIAFAAYVASPDFTTSQLRSLVEIWTTNNYLGDNLRWCTVGMVTRPGIRYIATTSENEQIRFLEAGSLGAELRLFIRTRGTPLLSCIAKAIEACQDEEWAIIA
ncbi:hypothetical protein F4818DRAFT_341711 [Hypoxylon cercidicola]|nr:hypothetical protein F4818DRAFT_341711 [Hypoxylon cercidicola]